MTTLREHLIDLLSGYDPSTLAAELRRLVAEHPDPPTRAQVMTDAARIAAEQVKTVWPDSKDVQQAADYAEQVLLAEAREQDKPAPPRGVGIRARYPRCTKCHEEGRDLMKNTQCPDCGRVADEANLWAAVAADAEAAEQRLKVRTATETAVNTAYGTDPRHGLIGIAVAEAVVDDKPLPWGLAAHFGAWPENRGGRR